jgi:hypothetical protein
VQECPILPEKEGGRQVNRRRCVGIGETSRPCLGTRKDSVSEGKGIPAGNHPDDTRDEWKAAAPGICFAAGKRNRVNFVGRERKKDMKLALWGVSLLLVAFCGCGGGSGGGSSGSSPSGGGGSGGGGGGATTGSSYPAAAEDCFDLINQYRASIGLPPYQRWTDEEACADSEAKRDAEANRPHGSFGSCGEWAQNTCPGWPGTPESMIGPCLQAMWAEGPGSDFSTHGHYINMSSTNYTRVACGFYVTPDGRVWTVQDFR